MSGEGTGLDPQVEVSVLVQEVLSYREKLQEIAIDDVLSEDHSVEMLESLGDQYLGIGAQLRIFRQDCETRGTRAQLEVVDDVLTELNNEIAVHVSMIRKMIWAKRSTYGVPDGRQSPDDQLTREVKQELSALYRVRERMMTKAMKSCQKRTRVKMVSLTAPKH